MIDGWRPTDASREKWEKRLPGGRTLCVWKTSFPRGKWRAACFDAPAEMLNEYFSSVEAAMRAAESRLSTG
jgi:hypothetical protein